jgi:uncharacterized protein YbcI
MGGFRFQYRLSGGRPTVGRFGAKNAKALNRGDIVNFENGEVDLGVTGDTALLGAVADTVNGDRPTTSIAVVTDADAVYGVDDPIRRAKGATLDLIGLTGLQSVGASRNAEFVVVRDCGASEETLVRINSARHHASAPAQRGKGTVGGELNAAIARDIVRHHSNHRGRGPTKAKAFYRDNIVVVVLQDAMTTPERTLAATGRTHVLMDVRRAFQDTMRADMVASVERRTGCKVQALLSASHIDPDYSSEVFILDRAILGEPSASD